MLLQKLRRAVRPNIVLPSVDHNWRFFFPSRVLPNQHAAAVRQASSMHMQQISASSQDAVDLYDTAVTEVCLVQCVTIEIASGTAEVDTCTRSERIADYHIAVLAPDWKPGGDSA